MSQAITLQADLTVTCVRPGGPRITIPSGTVLTFPDAVATQMTGYYYSGAAGGLTSSANFATALNAVADFLKEIGGRAALAANASEFTPQTINGQSFAVAFGPDGQAIFTSTGASTSASPSSSPSPSASPSHTPSASPSASPSSTPSASPSKSPSASPSASSDARLKNNIVPIMDALSKITGVHGVAFEWNDDSVAPGQKDMGVIAQDVERVFPELVSTVDGFKRVHYNGLIGVLFAAVSELHAKVEALEEKRHFAAGA